MTRPYKFSIGAGYQPEELCPDTDVGRCKEQLDSDCFYTRITHMVWLDMFIGDEHMVSGNNYFVLLRIQILLNCIQYCILTKGHWFRFSRSLFHASGRSTELSAVAHPAHALWQRPWLPQKKAYQAQVCLFTQTALFFFCPKVPQS